MTTRSISASYYPPPPSNYPLVTSAGQMRCYSAIDVQFLLQTPPPLPPCAQIIPWFQLLYTCAAAARASANVTHLLQTLFPGLPRLALHWSYPRPHLRTPVRRKQRGVITGGKDPFLTLHHMYRETTREFHREASAPTTVQQNIGAARTNLSGAIDDDGCCPSASNVSDRGKSRHRHQRISGLQRCSRRRQ